MSLIADAATVGTVMYERKNRQLDKRQSTEYDVDHIR
jgi:hypothetical protein